MADDIQRAERQRLNLMADVAHELRTPLSNIQGYVEAMKDGIINPSDETLRASTNRCSSSTIWSRT